MSKSFVSFSLRTSGALCAVLSVLCAARPASADVVSKINPANCRIAWFKDVDSFDRSTANKTLQAKASNAENLKVYCPITKKTSGPAVTGGDGIKSVTLTTATTGLVDCSIITRRVSVSYWDDNNLVPPTSGAIRTSAGSLTITTPSNRAVRYWNANGTPPAGSDYNIIPAWYYSYLSCNMAPGTKISGDITVTEAGTATGYTIDPMITCPLTSDMGWRFPDTENPAGGFVMAQAGDHKHLFSFACPVPNNAVVDVAATSSTLNPSGCNVNNSNFSTFKYSLVDANASEWPSLVLSQPYMPVIGLPAQGTNTLYCGQSSESGDGKWFSYRVKPNHKHTGAPDNWTASSSEGATGVTNAIDANGSTRWTTNKAAKAGMWFQVYVGGQVVNEITFDSGSDAEDYPRLFTILGSYDGVSFSELGQGTGSNGYVSFAFGEAPYYYYRIRLDKDIKTAAGATKYWSIHELNLYLNDGTR